MSASARVGAPAPSEPVRLRTDRLHDEVIRTNIGWGMEPWKWAASCERRAALEDQTARLADLLEAVGVPARTEASVVAIGAVTGVVQPLSTWRPVRFLPAVAARDRRPMLNALRFWARHEARAKGDYLRYGVVTAGDLVPAFGDLRGALQDLARRVSKWASEASDRYDVTVHFRGSEFTRKTAGERDLADRFPADRVLYHPHANLMFEPMRHLPEKGEGSWAEFLSWTADFFGSHWRDCGRVEDVRELVKYVVKPGDLLDGDSPLTSDEAVWLHDSLFRLNLAQPLGDFRLFWRDLSQNRRKVVALRDGNRSRLVTVEKSRRLGRAEPAEGVDAEAGDGAGGEDGEMAAPGEEQPERPKPCPVNHVLGVTLPQWAHTPWAEPLILVQNYQPKAVGKAACERLDDIKIERMVARQMWDDAGAPPPATALRVAREWRERGAASNVTPLAPRPSKASPEAAPYRVHTRSLTVRPEGTGGEAEGRPAGARGLRLVVRRPPEGPPDTSEASPPKPTTAPHAAPRAGGVAARALDASARRLFAVGGSLVDRDGVIAGDAAPAPRTHAPSPEAIARDALGLRFGARGNGEAIAKAVERAQAEAARLGLPFDRPDMRAVMQLVGEAR